MPTVTIGGTAYFVYQDTAEIDAYAAAAIGDNADAWRAAELEDKQRGAVSATRLIDRQTWQGLKATDSQDGQFPRSGLKFADGTAVPSDLVPQQLNDADCELAMALVAGAPVQDQADTANMNRRLKAGSVEIEYFRAITGSPRFPQIVTELVGLWLGGSAPVFAGSFASGVDGSTAFTDDYRFSRPI